MGDTYVWKGKLETQHKNLFEAKSEKTMSAGLEQLQEAYLSQRLNLSDYASVDEFNSRVRALYGEGKTLHGKRMEFAWGSFVGGRFLMSEKMDAPFDLVDTQGQFAQQLKLYTQQHGEEASIDSAGRLQSTLSTVSGGSIHQRLSEDVSLKTTEFFQFVVGQRTNTGSNGSLELGANFSDQQIITIPKKLLLKNLITYNSVVNQIFTPKGKIRYKEIEEIWNKELGGVTKAEALEEADTWRRLNEQRTKGNTQQTQYSQVFSQKVLNILAQKLADKGLDPGEGVPLLSFHKTGTTYHLQGFYQLLGKQLLKGRKNISFTRVSFPGQYDSEARYYINYGELPHKWQRNAATQEAVAQQTEYKQLNSKPRSDQAKNYYVAYNAYYSQNPIMIPKNQRKFFVLNKAEFNKNEQKTQKGRLPV